MGKYLTPLGFVVTVAGVAWLIAPALPQMIRDFRDGDDSVRRLVKFLGIWLIGIGMMLLGLVR